MWVFTTFGFFSIVAHRTRPMDVLIRARDRSDLRALVKRLPKPHPRIHDTPGADYAFRAIVPRDAIGTRLNETAADLNYDNFKNAVSKEQGPRRAHLYHDVWEALLPLQRVNPWPPRNAL